jgi:O-methyltransferase
MSLEEISARVIAEVRPYTMVPPENLAQTIKLTIDSIETGRAGHLVECGTWKGGSSFAMLLAQRYRFGQIVKPIWMFDSFQGLPPADERDGPLALQYQRETDSPGYLDNCRAPLDEVRSAIDMFDFAETEAIVVPGWFHDTIPAHRDALDRSGIAVLRVDCDWYEPVLYILDALAPCVTEEGAIILDDYFAWDGCARAVHDHLSRNALAWRIRSMDKFYGAWMMKRSHRILDL